MNKGVARAGFSIVEVLVAMAIVGIVFAISTNIVINSSKMTRSAQTDAQAQAFAKSYLDSVKALWNVIDFYQRDVLPTSASGTLPYPPPTGYTYVATVISYDPSTPTSVGPVQNSYSYVAGTPPTANVSKAVSPILMKSVRLDVTETNANRTSTFFLRLSFRGSSAW